MWSFSGVPIVNSGVWMRTETVTPSHAPIVIRRQPLEGSTEADGGIREQLGHRGEGCAFVPPSPASFLSFFRKTRFWYLTHALFLCKMKDCKKEAKVPNDRYTRRCWSPWELGQRLVPGPARWIPGGWSYPRPSVVPVQRLNYKWEQSTTAFNNRKLLCILLY